MTIPLTTRLAPASSGTSKSTLAGLQCLAIVVGLAVNLVAQVQADDTSDNGNDQVVLEELQSWLDMPTGERPEFGSLTGLDAPLSAEASQTAGDLLWADLQETWCTVRLDEWNDHTITLGDHTMPFTVREFGEQPEAGWSVYISMHGGGETATQVNDQQWQNQQQLYQLEEGLYITPRAPTDTWNMWHQGHIDLLFERLIQDLVAFNGANADRVFLLGYSAGGDGVYQLAPRMADRFAAASMMAGHPNEASPLGLRNLPFAIHCGALDAAYNRNTIAIEWGKKLDDLQAADPEGYTHICELHAGKGHWMDLEDAVALEWMSEFTRQPAPSRIVWRQDDVVHSSFYWLCVDADAAEAGDEITASIEGQTITIHSENVAAVTVLLNDDLVDLDEPVTITFNDRTAFEGPLPRTLRHLQESLHDRGDRQLMYSASCRVPQ